MVGTTLGKFHVDSQISVGGMGAVYRATHVETGQVVAIKVLQQALATDRAFLQRFRREVAALQKVQHPNVVRIYDVGSEENTHYYAMEHLGTSLAEMLQSGPLETQRAVQIASQVARGLGAVHAAGICHRDVKPGNILLDEQGNAKIADFGIVRVSDATRVTQTGVIVGTPTYMAPEQVDNMSVDARADVYSLGVVLYETLVGRPPFQGNTTLDVLRKHRYTLPEPPKSFRPQLPGALSHLVVGMLAKEPAKRPGTMAMVADALDHLGQNLAEETTRERDRPARRELNSDELASRGEQTFANLVTWAKLAVGIVLLLLVAFLGYRLVAYLRRDAGDYLREAREAEATDKAAAVGLYQALLRRYPKAPETVPARDRLNVLRDEQRREATTDARAKGSPKDTSRATRVHVAYLHYLRAGKQAQAGDVEHARQIYRMIRGHFSDTDWAAKADQRLQELDGKTPGPPTPPPDKGTPAAKEPPDGPPPEKDDGPAAKGLPG